MNWIKGKRAFRIFLLSVVVVFFYKRPLNTSWNRLIASDGLGYYAYLPAIFIYHDYGFNYKWFNTAHDANYSFSPTANPEDNLLVVYGNKRVNKYYQGLAFIWTPFFITGHIAAKVLHYPPDGFSLPYQLSIGLASLFYLLLGLVFLRRLLLRLFKDPLAANLTTMAIFYGTHLYTLGIYINSFAHLYSFTFITLFAYFLVVFFAEGRLRDLLWCFLCFVICITIRPLTGLIIFIVPAFWQGSGWWPKLRGQKLCAADWMMLGLTAGVGLFSAGITWIQTGSVIADTYQGEGFRFGQGEFLNALIGYRNGLFLYTPLVFLSLFGIPFFQRRQRIILPLLLFFVIYLYSCWWHWPILRRAIVDFYVLPAMFLTSLITVYQGRARLVVVWLVILCAAYYQLKNYQVKVGILDEYCTYKEVFWKNFFKLQKTATYLIPPSSIIEKEEYAEDFESPAFRGHRTTDRKTTGKYALLIDSANYFATMAEYPYPSVFRKTGTPKIRFSFNSFFESDIHLMHAFIRFIDKNGKTLLEKPFYINDEDIIAEKWERREYGYSINGDDNLDVSKVEKIVFLGWNVGGRKNIYVDDFKVEFILANNERETIR